MDKFLNRSRKAELEPNQNNAFPEEIPSMSSGQKKTKTVISRKYKKIIFCSDLLSLRMLQNLLRCA